MFPHYDTFLPKFSGPLQPYNYERLQRQGRAAQLADRVRDFHQASARFQLVQYKAEHEAMLRTRDYAGYQLLMLNDFTGQSEALVGILDPFWESKGVVTAEDVRAWNSPTVPLARFDRYVWSTQQELDAQLEVAHFGPHDLTGVTAAWKLTTSDQQTVGQGQCGPLDVATGQVTPLGTIRLSLAAIQRSTKLTLQLQVADAQNSWNLWAYPPPPAIAVEGNTLIARRWDTDVEQALNAGQNVLLLIHGLQNSHCGRTSFLSVYWSGGWWGDRFSSLGVVCNPQHPALAGFPNEGHSDWQWFELLEGATAFDLTGELDQLQPIVQPVTDFHHNRRLAHVWEVRVGAGRLLVCGYDLASELETRPAARQFWHSLLQYLQGAQFRPELTISLDQARGWFGT